jgi:hypothetical protein
MSLVLNLELKDMPRLFIIIPEKYPLIIRDMLDFLNDSTICSSLNFNEGTKLNCSINY